MVKQGFGIVCAMLFGLGCKPPDVKHVTSQDVTELRYRANLVVNFNCTKETGTINQEINQSMKDQAYDVPVDVGYFTRLQPNTTLSRKEDVIKTAQQTIKAVKKGGAIRPAVYLVKASPREEASNYRYVTSSGGGGTLSANEFEETQKQLQAQGKVLIPCYEQNADGSYDKVLLVRTKALSASDVQGMQPLTRYPVKVKVFAVSYDTTSALKAARNQTTQHEFNVDVPKRVYDAEGDVELWDSRAVWNSKHGTVMRAEVTDRLKTEEDKSLVAVKVNGRDLIMANSAVR